MKMFFSTLGTETNSFSPIPTGYNVWKDMMLFHRDEPVEGLDPGAVLGALCVERGWDFTRGLIAYAQPAGPTPKRVYEELRDELLRDIKDAMPVDGVALLLHGAMIAEGYDDCEGDTLKCVRELVGPDVPVGAVLDLHCNVSDLMLSEATALVGYKEYPHVDIVDRLTDLFHILADTAEGKVSPVISSRELAMIGLYHTTSEPMYSFVRDMEKEELRDGVLNVWLAHCFPWGDVPFLGARTVVVTDNRPDLGEEIAVRFADRFYNMRNEAASWPETMKECLRKALAAKAGPVTIADTADNPGGGAPADSTFFLEEMIAQGISGAAVATFWDPVAVTICQDAGVGAHIELRLGGKMGPSSGRPLDVSATVIGLSDNVLQELGGVSMSMGHTAAIKVHTGPARDDRPESGIDVILSRRRIQTVAPNVFTDLGIDPTAKKILVVKSTQHFHAGFAPISKEILYAGDQGALIGDMTKIPYRNVDTSGMWPFTD